MKCDKCLKDFPEREIHEHHIHPRFMDNKNGLGMKINLCEKCHNILHQIIPSIIWKYILDDWKQICIDDVTNFTFKYINKRGENDRLLPT